MLFTGALETIKKERLSLETTWLVKANYQLGEAYYASARMQQAVPYLHRALELLNRPYPTTSTKLILNLLLLLAIQGRNLMGLNLSASATDAPPTQTAALIMQRLAVISYLSSQRFGALYSSLRGLSLAQRAGEIAQSQMAVGAAQLSVAFQSVKVLQPVAAVYSRRAMQYLDGLQDPDSTILALIALGVYEAGRANFDVGRKRLHQGLDIATEIGNFRRWEEAAGFLNAVERHSGHYDRALELATELRDRGERQRDYQAANWGYIQRAKRFSRPGAY